VGREKPRLDALDLPVLLELSVVLQGLVEDLDCLALAASDDLALPMNSASSAVSFPSDGVSRP